MTAETVLEDPFAAATEDGLVDDPFATADEASSKGGPFVPWPGIEAVSGRLVVLVPRNHDENAPVSPYLQRTYNLPATREEWKVDLVVLDGGKLEYEYRSKVEGTEDTYEKKTFTVDAADLPFLVPNWKITWGNIMGTLSRTSKTAKPFVLARIRAGYSIKEMRAGKTYEQFKAEQDEFYANPRGKKEPRPVWHAEVTDAPADRALALNWWKAARANGFTL